MQTGSIKAILACDDEGGIAKDGTLPWPHNEKDMRWFRDNTLGHVVVMGSTTWKDSHMPRPMPKRYNVLVTSTPELYPEAHEYLRGNIGHLVCLLADNHPGLITWVIGGTEVINQTLDSIKEFYISRIPGKYNCDTFLPLKDIEEKFELAHVTAHPEVVFEIWRRK